MLIIGRTDTDVTEVAHKLRVKNTSSRQNREVSYASVVSDGKPKTDNDDKFNKKFDSSFKRSYSMGTSDKPGQSIREKPPYNRSSSDSSDDVNFEFKLKNGMVLKVYKASILNIDVEVIVNAANDTMMHGGGVARVISQAAGWDLDKESSDYVTKHGPVPVKENIVTTSGKLSRYKAVIHAVGPEWYKYREKVKCLDDLFDCVYNILDTCKKEDFQTVGMSAISAGIFAVPKELCADMYVYAAAKFSASLSPSDCPKELHIVDIDTSILKLVDDSVKRWQKDPESLNPRQSVPKYLKENPHLASSSSYSSNGGHRSRSNRSNRGHAYDRSHSNTGEEAMEWEDEYGSGQRHKHRESNKLQIELSCQIKHLPSKKLPWGAIATQYLLDGQITIKIYEGKIEKVKDMDAIVCGIDQSLQSSGFIAKSLSKAGGSSYMSACREMEKKHAKNAAYGNVYKCIAGELGVTFVLHAVVKRIMYANSEEIEAYEKCMLNILKEADKNGLRKVALPLIGTGNIQTNIGSLKKCGGALLKAIDSYIKNDSRIEIEIHLINNETKVLSALKEVFEEAANSRNKGTNNNSQFSAENTKGAGGHWKGSGMQSPDREKEMESGSDFEKKHNLNASGGGWRHSGSYEKGNANRDQGGTDQGGTGSSDEDSDHYDKIQDVGKTVTVRQENATPAAEANEKKGNLMILEN